MSYILTYQMDGQNYRIIDAKSSRPHKKTQKVFIYDRWLEKTSWTQIHITFEGTIPSEFTTKTLLKTMYMRWTSENNNIFSNESYEFFNVTFRVINEKEVKMIYENCQPLIN